MILGVDKILKMTMNESLVKDLCERELKNPEGAGFDFRIGEIYEISGKGFLGVKERKTLKVKLVAKYDPKKKEKFVFKPGKYYLIKTIEKVNTPPNILILFRPRSTIFRLGMMIFTGNVAPGYKGELVFGIVNLGPSNVEIELGARIVHAMFFEVKGKTALYRGQWQGGRVTTRKKEKQV